MGTQRQHAGFAVENVTIPGNFVVAIDLHDARNEDPVQHGVAQKLENLMD